MRDYSYVLHISLLVLLLMAAEILQNQSSRTKPGQV